MANELQVRISAETAGLEAGLSRATSAVESSAQSMKEAQTAAAAAAQNYADTLAALNVVASGTGPGQAAAAAEIAATKTAADQAAAALEKLNIAKLRSSNSWNREMAEANRAAEAEAEAARAMELAALRADILSRANEQLAVTNEVVSATTGHVRGSMVAAAGAAGILEGRIPMRAMERFLASIPAVSAALQVAFPVIGAIALGEVLVQMVEHAHELYEKFIDLSAADDKLLSDFQKMKEADLLNVHSIETAKQRLDETTQSAEKLRTVAQGLHEVGLKGIFGDLVSGNLGAAGMDVGFLVSGKKAADASTEARENSIKLSLLELKQEHELAVAKIETAHAGDGSLSQAQQLVAAKAKELALIKEGQSYERKEERALGNTSPRDAGNDLAVQRLLQASAKENVGLAALRAKYAGEIAKAEIDVQHAADSELGPVERITAELQKQLSLHAQAAEASRSGLPAEDQRLKQLQDEASTQKAIAEINAAGHDELMKTFDVEMKAQDEGRKQAEEAQKRAAEEFKKDQAEHIALVKESAQATIQAAQETFTFTQRQIEFETQLGLITVRTAQARLLAASQLKQTETTGALKKEQALFDPNLGNKEFQEYTQLQHRMTQEAQKGALEREQITQKETLRIIEQYRKVAIEFNHGFTQAINGWITGSQTASQAFARMFGEMELQLIDFVAEWLLKKAEMWVLDHALQISGVAAQKTVQATANVGTVMGDAGVAFAGTMAYYSAINPPAAPALASAAYATTLAGGLTAQAFELGGVVAGSAGAPVPIIAHAGERVLNQSETAMFHSLVNSQTSTSSNSRVVNMGGITQNLAGARATPREISSATEDALRRGMLKGGW